MANTQTKTPPPVIKNDKDKPLPVEIIAESIVEVAKGFRAMRNSRLTRRAIMILIKDSCTGNVTLSDISKIMDAAADLDKNFIKR